MHKQMFFECPSPGQSVTSNTTAFADCVLTMDVGEFPAGTAVGAIMVNFSKGRFWFDVEGTRRHFKVEVI